MLLLISFSLAATREFVGAKDTDSIQHLSRWFIVTNRTAAVVMVSPPTCDNHCQRMTGVWERAGSMYPGLLWTANCADMTRSICAEVGTMLLKHQHTPLFMQWHGLPEAAYRGAGSSARAAAR